MALCFLQASICSHTHRASGQHVSLLSVRLSLWLPISLCLARNTNYSDISFKELQFARLRCTCINSTMKFVTSFIFFYSKWKQVPLYSHLVKHLVSPSLPNPRVSLQTYIYFYSFSLLRNFGKRFIVTDISCHSPDNMLKTTAMLPIGPW